MDGAIISKSTTSGNNTSVSSPSTLRSSSPTPPTKQKQSIPKTPKVWNPFNESNPHSKSWCPFAACYNSPLCTPCNRRYLLIIATGRSGSTTLLKMMNYLPGVRLSGENMNELHLTYLLEKNLIGESGHNILHIKKDQAEGAFAHNFVPKNSMSCPIQHVIQTINPPPYDIQLNDNMVSIQDYDKDTIMGFKTIRLHKSRGADWNDEEGWYAKTAAEFIQRNFPCSRVLINIRSDIEGQAKSMHDNNFGGSIEKNKNELEQVQTFYKNLASNLGHDMSRLLDMNEWTKDVNIINEVIEWLGFEGCRFKTVLHENLDGYQHDYSKVDLGTNCRYPQINHE